MKHATWTLKKGLILVGLAATVATGIFVASSVTAQTEDKLNTIHISYTQHQAMLSLDQERKASINKVLGIISRYNRSMDDSLKLAIANEIYNMAQKYPNLNVDFICATITHESAKTWDPQVTSHVGAMGLMQVMPATGAFLAVEEGVEWTRASDVLYDPITNIRLGTRYLNDLVGMYSKDGGLAAYNAGPRHAERWIAQNRNNKVLYRETRKYVPAVLALYDQYRSEEKM